MSAYLSVHNVDRIAVNAYHPNNNHTIELRLVQGDDNCLRISVFGLPEDRAVALIRLLGDAETTVYYGGRAECLSDYLTTKGVFDAIEGE